MTDIEQRPGHEIVLPGTGQVVNLEDEVGASLALDALRGFESQIAEAKRTLVEAIAQRSAVLGSKSIRLPDGRTAQVSGGKETIYDSERIERELREAGCPEERIREIVEETVTYRVRAVEAKRAAAANPEYRRIIEDAQREIEKPFTVTLRR